MLEAKPTEIAWPKNKGEAQVIAEMDGSMVPIMAVSYTHLTLPTILLV